MLFLRKEKYLFRKTLILSSWCSNNVFDCKRKGQFLLFWHLVRLAERTARGNELIQFHTFVDICTALSSATQHAMSQSMLRQSVPYHAPSNFRDSEKIKIIHSLVWELKTAR